MPEPSLRNWRSSPPQGGWAITYVPPEHPEIAVSAQGTSHQQVLKHIRAWRINNGLPPNDDQVFDFANRIWCQRDPKRCTEGAPTPEPTAGSGRRILTPADYGRSVWGFLATFGISFNPILWQSAVAQTRHLLNPHNMNNNGSGCATCATHFQEFIERYPTDKVTSDEEAGVWVFLAHDEANKWSGKAHQPLYRQAAALHGWKPLGDQQFELVKSRLAK